MLAGVFALGLGEELWSRFIPKYLEFLGAGIWIIGIFGVVKDLLDALYQYPGGWLADRLGHRRSLILFTLLALGGYLLLMISQGWEFILLGMIFITAWGSSATPVIFTIIGDNLPATSRSIGFGVQSILKRLPVLLAPVLGGWAILQFGLAAGMRASFAASIILAITGRPAVFVCTVRAEAARHVLDDRPFVFEGSRALVRFRGSLAVHRIAIHFHHHHDPVP